MRKSREELIKEVAALTLKIEDDIKSNPTLSETDKKEKLRKLALISRIIETADGLVSDLESKLPIELVLYNMRQRLYHPPFESGGVISKSNE